MAALLFKHTVRMMLHRQLQLPMFAADCQAGNGKIDEVYSICFTKQNDATFWV